MRFPRILLEYALKITDHFLKANPHVVLSVRVNFALDIARGMYHLHSENIVHRDLAARNILLNSALVAKVIR